MSKLRIAGILLGVLLATAGSWQIARADAMSEATKVTFKEAVRIPGRVLPAGTYYFKRIDDGNDPNVNLIRIFNIDNKPVNVIVQTITIDRGNDRGKTILTFAEDRKGQPPALVAWFYPGSLSGHEFVYSAPREREIERSKPISLAATPTGDMVVNNTSAQ
ncbi:MAG: hypothetical protein WB630_17585 [Candidatus Acidiferrales bacterium]